MGAIRTNAFLGALRPESAAEMISKSKLVEMPLGTRLFHPEQKPDYVHFIQSGVASVVTPFREGGLVEVGLVGNESFPEKLQLLGPGQTACECFMQISGSAYRMPYDLFQSEFMPRPEIVRAVMRHAQAEWLALLQLSGCNRVHSAEARLARWLLMVSDRMSPEIELTHEFLAYMLGTRRGTVTVIAGALQKAGMIAYRRGHIKILERGLLEDTACECYGVCRRIHRGLMPDQA